MTIQRLPVPARVFGGEGLISYASRHATRNGTTVEKIERSLSEAGAIPKPSHRQTPERLQAWRRLGALHESAFATPAVIDGADVIDRMLCLRCTQGSGGTGRLPRIGWVCPGHRRWLGTPQHDIRALPELVAAERHYRRVLAPRGVLVRSPIMQWARECAITGIAQSDMTERNRRGATSNPNLLTYPETVRIARLVPRAEDNESWRVAHRITAMFNAIAGEIERNPSSMAGTTPYSTTLAQAWRIWGR